MEVIFLNHSIKLYPRTEGTRAGQKNFPSFLENSLSRLGYDFLSCR
jgi:hypothetical protein